MASNIHASLRRPLLWLSSLALVAGLSPALAQSPGFERVTLSASSAGVSLSGRTVGSYALSNIVATDVAGNICTGFADTTPDHVLTLESDISSLTLTVESGQDTTLLVQGPDDNTVRCGQDISRGNLDAQISATNWKAGTYRIWVGAFNQAERFSYTLTAE